VSLILQIARNATTPKPLETVFQWNGWTIKVNEIVLADSVPSSVHDSIAANKEAVFVVFSFTVRNDRDEGAAFEPDYCLKLLAGGKAIDCANWQPDKFSYWNNIEATLSQARKCYFEVPRDLLKAKPVIRFQVPGTRAFDIMLPS